MHITTFGGRPGLPDHVMALASAVDARSEALRSTEDPKGGLRREDLLAALAPAVRGTGLGLHGRGSFCAAEVDLIDAPNGIAMSIQAGRARTNNGAVTAVLAAAAMDDVSWLVLLIPERYKGSVAAKPVLADLELLRKARGVTLALEAVVTIAY